MQPRRGTFERGAMAVLICAGVAISLSTTATGAQESGRPGLSRRAGPGGGSLRRPLRHGSATSSGSRLRSTSTATASRTGSTSASCDNVRPRPRDSRCPSSTSPARIFPAPRGRASTSGMCVRRSAARRRQENRSRTSRRSFASVAGAHRRTNGYLADSPLCTPRLPGRGCRRGARPSVAPSSRQLPRR